MSMPYSLLIVQSFKNASQYLIVFVRPHNLDEVQVPKPLARVKIGQSFDDCLQQDRVLSRQMMTAQRLHVHVNQEGQVRLNKMQEHKCL